MVHVNNPSALVETSNLERSVVVVVVKYLKLLLIPFPALLSWYLSTDNLRFHRGDNKTPCPSAIPYLNTNLHLRHDPVHLLRAITSPDKVLKCYFCGCKMHFTKYCTGFEDAQIKILVELKQNLLMVCNGCKPKKTSNICSAEENSAMALNMKALEAKMVDFMNTMEQSAIKVDELKAEMTKLKTESQPPSHSYASKVGAATAGRLTFANTFKESL